MHLRLFLVLCAVLLIGAGCSQPTAAPTPTRAATPVAAPTSVATRAAPPTASPLPPATLAPPPTATAPPPTATVVPTAVPSLTATPEPRAVVQADLVNLRAGPAVTHPVIGQAKVGQALRLLARTETQPAWYEVCCAEGQKTGWVRSDLLTLPAGAGAAVIPVVRVVPTPPPAPTAAPVPTAAPAAPRPAPNPAAPPPPPAAGSVPGVNPFTGLPGGNLARRPVFVCLNNDPEARPQFGLNAADLIYEYVMEGRGITRYAALYWSQDAPRIGPVRSARLINVQMAPLYGAALLCSGASSEVRYILKYQVHFPYLDVDLDDPSNTVYSFSIGNDYRSRLQTDSGRLERYVRDWSVNAIPGTRGLRFGDSGGGTPATQVSIPYPRLARTGWIWNGGQWARLGSDGGPYLDGATGAQVTADNVVIQWAAHEATGMVEDSLGTTGIRIVLVGSGPVKVLRDGRAIDGVWRAGDPNQPPEFFDAGGAPIALHPGRTWFEIVEPYYQVEIK